MGEKLDAVHVRPWEPRDRDAVARLLRLLAEHAVVRSATAPTFVAEADGRVVGMVTICVFTTLTGTKAYLDHLVVDADWRGRGIGRRLVQHAIDQARAAGASRIDLTAGEAKVAGQALYRSLGFRERDTTSFRLELPT